MRSVKVSVCLACCDCCLVMRSIVKTGGYSGIGPSGQPAARLSWRLFSFMYDAWGSSVARGEVQSRLGFQVFPPPVGDPAATLENPSIRAGDAGS